MPPNSETLLCHYHYDPLDRLVATTPLKQDAFQRFYCKSRLATEIQGQVRRSIFQQDDQLLAQQEHQSDTLLLATDQQRSVLHTVSAHQQPPIVYSPYGHRPAESGLLSLLGFNGERPDPLTGHYLLGNGYRAFNPVLMRFNSPDNLSPFGKGGLNGYAYCSGDPVNNSDPTGHFILQSRVRTMVSGWSARAKSNLTLPVGGSVTHTYTVKSPGLLSAVEAPESQSAVVTSTSVRYKHEPHVTHHQYASGIKRKTISEPTGYEQKFNRTSGNQLDNIFISQEPDELFRGLRAVENNSSRINIDNYFSVSRFSNDPLPIDSEVFFSRVNTAMAGKVPGVMPSKVQQYLIRQGNSVGQGEASSLLGNKIRTRYSWLFY